MIILLTVDATLIPYVIIASLISLIMDVGLIPLAISASLQNVMQ
jgi:hypothetical protein